MNNWQRAHLNFLETYSVVVVMSLITAINQPLWASVVGYALVLGRIFYGLEHFYLLVHIWLSWARHTFFASRQATTC